MVTGKFKCIEITEYECPGKKVKFAAVMRDKANVDWSQWTPSGTIEMNITNPAALDQFKVGEEYDLTLAQV